MCSVQEGEDLAPIKAESSSLAGRKCLKCSSEECVVIIRINDAFCRDCFLAYCTHKFRSAFGKSHLIRDKERVIVAHSGGAASTAMLHLIQEGTSKRAHKKLRFSSSLVYIDDGALHGKSLEQRVARNAEVQKQFSQTGLDSYAYSIEQVMSDCTDIEPQPFSDDILSSLALQTSHLTQLLSLLSSVKSDTSIQNMHHFLRNQLLKRIALGLEVEKILLGSNTTNLAVQLISNVTQGRGAHLLYDMSFADKRSSEVMFVRPLREFTAHEINHYLIECNLNAVDESHLRPKGLEGLTSDFVLGLQADFPNTVSTIMRTGEKMGSSVVDIDSDQCCCLCQAPLDTDVGDCSALAATEFSQLISRKTDSSSQKCSDNPSECCGQGDGSCKSSSRNELPDLRPLLCYGCRLVSKDLPDSNLLPSNIKSNVMQRSNRADLRAAIEDFLITDE